MKWMPVLLTAGLLLLGGGAVYALSQKREEGAQDRPYGPEFNPYYADMGPVPDTRKEQYGYFSSILDKVKNVGMMFIPGMSNLDENLIGQDCETLWGSHDRSSSQLFNQGGKIVEYTYWELCNACSPPTPKSY